ncbi:MAG: flagellar protein FlbB [Pseudolabrys sp.]|jgi:flagellar motility protein MotE (MotC chaperone)
MIRFAREFRLIPLVLLAAVCLLTLKVAGLLFDGGYTTLGERLASRGTPQLKASTEAVPDFTRVVVENEPPKPAPKKSWAQEMFNYGGDFSSKNDVTGSVGESKEAKPEAKPAEGAAAPDPAEQLKITTKPPDNPKLEVGGAEYKIEAGHINSPGERAILERLRDRSQTLDARNRELEMRENLLKAAEKRVEGRVNELKTIQSHVDGATEAQEQTEQGRFKSIVAMYENMKAKDAARIFDRLDLKILVEVTTLINPRKMSDILAQMTPETAEKLTVELANRATQSKKTSVDALPKIEGQPAMP